ncbi:Plasma-membrane_choline transporter [Hexamita inflata]|uniref:Choline transporter-like protein n=1 Tax=Hexamita inflata TaxID=28002 RepID=A0AA86TWX4_9EUKA|nr:Plasma-membrane choline transporter [Hexamita inflata]CAI9969353.1 Plasma-membrane choline transporter [Hexamita inflata]
MVEKAKEILLADEKLLTLRKCWNWFCIISFLLEFTAMLLLFFFSNVALDYNQVKKAEILSAAADPMSRVCGYPSNTHLDIESPNLIDITNTDSGFSQSNMQSICILFNQAYQVSFDCTQLTGKNAKYYEYIYKLSSQLPDPGRVAVQTAKSTICMSNITVSATDKCGATEAYLCSIEFGVLANLVDPSLSITSNQQQFTSDQWTMLVNSLNKTGANYSFLFNLCSARGNVNYLPIATFEHFDRCDVDSSTSFTAIFSSLIKLPTYISYMITYFQSLKTQFMVEIQAYIKPIAWSFISALVLSFVYILLVLLFTKIIIIASSATVPLVLFVIGGLLTYVLNNSFFKDQFMFDTFGYLEYSTYVYGALLIVAIIIIFLLAILMLLMFLVSMDDKSKISDCIGICKAILRKRFRIYFTPVFYILCLFIHLAICVYIMMLIMFNGAFDSKMGVITFIKMSKSYVIEDDYFKICCMTITVFYLFHGIFLFYGCLQYALASLTFNWYDDRVEGTLDQIKQQEQRQIQAAANPNTVSDDFAQLGLNRKNMSKVFNKKVGSQHGRSTWQLIRSIGMMMCYSFTQIFLWIPRLFMLLVYYIQNKSDFAMLNKKQSKAAKLMNNFIEYMVSMTDKRTVLYAALTGCNYSTAFKHWKYIYGFNTTVVNDIGDITSRIVVIGKIIISVSVILFEQFLEKLILGTAMWTFKLTPVILCFIISYVISGMVLNLISITNTSLIMVYNFDQEVGKEPDMHYMPTQFRRVVDHYNLQSRKHKFNWKKTVQCFIAARDDIEAI